MDTDADTGAEATECLCTCPVYRHYRGGACSTGGCACRRLRIGVLHGPPPPSPPASTEPPTITPDPEPAAVVSHLFELPPDVPPELPAPPTKRCPCCTEEKPLTGFYERERNGRTSAQGWCKACQKAASANATSTVTVPKLLRNRARHRAVAALVARHQADFDALYERAKAEVAAEAARIAAVPAAAEHYGDQPIRLRPGPRLPFEEIVDRIDVGRCPDCARHHDAGHACPACGATPAGPQLTLSRTGQSA